MDLEKKIRSIHDLLQKKKFLQVKEELEKLLIKYGLLEAPVQVNSVRNQNIEKTVDDIEKKVKANPETVFGIFGDSTKCTS